MATLGEARLKEMEALRALRAANEVKVLSSEEDTELKVCLCQKEPAAPMIQCELCRGFFHTACVSVPSVLQGPRVWLCPHCHRSEKPPLEKILPLLASLQRIRVRLPEGDALRYMIERTVNWQHRAQQMLYSGNLKLVQDKVGSGLLYSRWQSTAGPLPETNKVRLVGGQGRSVTPPWVRVPCVWQRRVCVCCCAQFRPCQVASVPSALPSAAVLASITPNGPGFPSFPPSSYTLM